MLPQRCAFAVAVTVLLLNVHQTRVAASCSSLDGPFCSLLTGRQMPDYALALIAAEPERQARSIVTEANAKGAIEQITQALLAAASQVAKQMREGKAGKVAERARKVAGNDGGEDKPQRDVKARGKSSASFPVPSAVRDKLSKGRGSEQQPFEVDEQGEVVAAATSAASDGSTDADDDASVVVVRASLPSDDGSQQTIEIRVVAADDEDDGDGDAVSVARQEGAASSAATTAAAGGKPVTPSGTKGRKVAAADDDDDDDDDDEGSEFIHLLSDGDVSALLRAARQVMTAEDDADAAADGSKSADGGDAEGSDEDSGSKLLLSVARMAAQQMRQSLSRRLGRDGAARGRKASAAAAASDDEDDEGNQG